MAAAKPNTFFGGAAILAVGILVVKVIGLFYKIPLVNIIGERGKRRLQQRLQHLRRAADHLHRRPAGGGVQAGVARPTPWGGRTRCTRCSACPWQPFLTLGVVSFLIMYFGSEQLAGMMHDSLAAAPASGAGARR